MPGPVSLFHSTGIQTIPAGQKIEVEIDSAIDGQIVKVGFSAEAPDLIFWELMTVKFGRTYNVNPTPVRPFYQQIMPIHAPIPLRIGDKMKIMFYNYDTVDRKASMVLEAVGKVAT